MEKDYHINKSYVDAPLRFGEVYLVQIGRLYFRGGGRVGEHLHRGWFELTVVTGGRGTVRADGVELPVKEGDIVLSLPAELHDVTSDAECPLHYDFFAFYTEDEILSAELERITAEYSAPDARVFSEDKIRTLIGVSIAELGDADALLGERLLSHLLEEIIIRLCRALRGVETPADDTPTGAERLCFRLQQYLDTHVFTVRSLGEVAALFGYNYSYLSTRFKKTTGITLSDYCREGKWRVARLLVRERRTPISEIAEMLGYSSVYVFSRAYRNRFGLAPSFDRAEDKEEA